MDCDMWANNYIHTPLCITKEILEQSHMLMSTEIKLFESYVYWNAHHLDS